MSSVLGVFGIDWHLLVINLINFSILLGALTYFLYRPITQVLDARRAQVTKGIHQAEQAAQQLKEIETTKAQQLAQATQTAEKIVADARTVALTKEREIIDRAEAVAATTLTEAQRQAAEAQREAVLKSKEEVAKLVVLGIERTLNTHHK